MADVSEIKYRAFVSYAHADGTWGTWVHRRLEAFRLDRDLVGRETARGTVPQTLRPIFRDRDEFTSGATLDAATIEALDGSASLVVLCSTIAASRPAVENEVRLFRARHPDRPVIPVIVEGKYPDNFPRSLLFDVAPDGTLTDRPTTILGPDLREEGDGRTLGLAKIVAGITGLGTDEIVRRAERQRRRVLRNWIVGLSAIALAMTGLAAVAELNRRQAQANLDIAIDSAEAYSSQLAGQFKTTSGLPRTEMLELLQSAQRLTDRITGISGQSDKHDESRARLYLVYAETYHQLGRAQEAMTAARTAKSIADALRTRQPVNVDAMRLADIADVRIAEIEGRDFSAEGVERARRNAAAFPNLPDLKRDLVIALNRIGDRQFDRGDTEGALSHYLDGERVLRDLARQPDIAAQPLVQADFATSLDRVAKAQMALNRPRDALRTIAASLQIMERLAEQQPWNNQISQSIAVSHEKAGSAHAMLREYEEALAAHVKARDIRDKLVRSDPLNVVYKSALLTSHSQIADVQFRLGRAAEAKTADEASLRLAREVTAADKGATLAYQRQLMIALNRVSAHVATAGDIAGARGLRREALGIVRQLAEGDRANVRFQLDRLNGVQIVLPVAENLEEIAALVEDARDQREAMSRAGQAADAVRSGWANVLMQAGSRAFVLRQFAAAERYLRQLVTEQPDVAANDAALAGALVFQDKLDEADRLYAKHAGKTVDGVAFADWIGRGFAAARALGFDHPHMAVIEARLKAPR